MSEDKETLFTFIQALFSKKKLTYNKKVANAYMLSLWLSNDDKLLGIVNRINKHLFSLDDELVWKYYFNLIPSGKRYIKYIKGDKRVSDDLESLKKEHPNLSSKEAGMIVNLLKGKNCEIR